jgi:signal transduction histidine kinase
VHAVRLAADLQSSRERLVTRREEERRRLRRDLHDGLGPTLASFALKLDVARKLVRPRPGDAEQVLSRLKDQTQDTVRDVRHLVYGLRPPALESDGSCSTVNPRNRHLAPTSFVGRERLEAVTDYEGHLAAARSQLDEQIFSTARAQGSR